MTDFSTAIPGIDTRDAARRVNYTLGMVLGVDDFEQQHAYLSGRDHAIVRDLIGYGTIGGLQVTLDVSDRVNGVQVAVSKGSAVNPRGQFIRVEDDQCAYINQWLAAQKTRLIKQRYDAVGDDKIVPVYIKLCYRECLTDSVPLPDQPCRSEDAALVPSRITDDYELMLDFEPPDQREEDELRRFILWLNGLAVQDGGGDPITSMDDFVALVLAHLPADADSDRTGVQPHPGTMPETTDVRLPLAQLPEYLRVAFRLWVTALRPFRLGLGQDAAGKPPVEACVLLARLDLPLQDHTGGNTPGEDDRGKFSVVPSRQVAIDETRRPYVLHLRALQEQLLYAQAKLQVGLAGDVTGALDDNEVQMLKTMRLAYSHDALPTEGQVLVARTGESGLQWTPETPKAGVPASNVVAQTSFGQSSVRGVSTDYARADHAHGTPSLPKLTGDIQNDWTAPIEIAALKTIPLAYKLDDLVAGQVLTLEAVPPPHPPETPPFQWVARTPETDGASFAPIVASGYVVPTADISEQQPLTFGDLRLAYTVDGLIGWFPSYVISTDQTNWGYVVKALPATSDPKGVFPVVAFGDFTDKGFTLYVRDLIKNELISGQQLARMRFMIEVTQVAFDTENR